MKPSINDINDNLALVYQGEHDIEGKLTNEELEEIVDYTRNIFIPFNPEQLRDVKARKSEMFSPEAPVMSKKDLDEVLDEDDSDARIVLSRLNALKMIKNDISSGPEWFASEAVNGYVLNMKRGALGLTILTKS